MAPLNLRKRLGLRSKSVVEDDNGSATREGRSASDALLMVPGQAGPPMALGSHRSQSVTSFDSKTRRRSRSPAAPSARDPLGLHLVHRPAKGKPKADIVFIHGLGGTSRSTWSKDRDPELFWPSMFLPLEQDICDMRIFTYGYNAEFMKAGGRSYTSILDFAKNLLYDMKFFIDDAAADLSIGKLPIIFVAHSMGGLIVKEAYIQGGIDPQYQDLVRNVTAILFLATPHRGSNFAETLNRILSVSFVSAPKEYVSDMVKNSATLQRINETFRHVVKGLDIVSFYETRPTRIGFDGNRIMVVEKDSSILGYPGEISKGLDADHHTVCKYGDREDPNYVTVRNFIRTQISNLLPSQTGGSRASIMSASPADIRELEKLFSVTEATDSDYIAFRDRWTPGTCEWILSNSSFSRWLEDPDPDARILWLHGAAGCGKSIMTSFIVNHLVENNKSCQYAFIRFGDQSKRSLSMTLRTLAFQVALVSPAFRQEMSKAASSLKRGADTSAIWRRVFKNVLLQSEFPNPLYWVIDGLEESDNPRAGIRMLTEVLGTAVPLRILIISRRTPEIDAEFKKIPEEAKWDAMAIDGHLDDHRRFVENELEWSEIPAFKESITKRLLHQSQGSFLWLRLTVERINKCRTTESVEQAMQELPAGMQELYDRMGRSISEQEPADRFLTCQILAWVTCAIRTLSVDELTEALESQSQARSIADPCAGFVSVDNYANVTLIHQTAKEYLLNSKGQPYSVERHASHERICLRCLQCLMKTGLRRDINKDMESPLISYASTYWSTHLLATAEMSNNLLQLVIQFLRGPFLLTWVHAVAKAKALHVLVQTSSNLGSLAKRLARSDANKMPLDRRTEEKELIEAWATDLGKIVGRFGSQLIHLPESIYKTIPPFCPPESPMFKQFGLKQKNNLKVGHFSNAAWGDSLGRLSLRRDEKATGLVSEGQWIAVLADHENMVSTVVIYQAATFQEARRLDIGERVRRVQINSMGTLIVTCGIRTTKVWNIATGSCVTTAANPRSRPRPMTIVFSKNDASVLIGSDDRRVWSMSLSSQESKIVEVVRFMQKSSGGRSVNSPTSMTISPDGQQVCLGYRSSPLAVWETELAEEVARHDELEDVAEILWHPFNGEVFGRQASGFIFKWHPDVGDPERQRAEVSTMAISSDGSLLAVGSHKGSFKLMSTSDMTFIHQGVSEHPVFGLAFSWDNQQLYDIRGKYGNVWQPDSLLRFSEPTAQLSDGGSVSGKSGRTASEETRYEFLDPVSALAPQSQGSLFCSGSEAGVLIIHDSKELNLRTLDEFTSFGIEQVAWSSDGRYVCFGDLSRTIYVISVSGAGYNVDNMDFGLHMKLSLSLSDNILQIIFNNDASLVLISSRSSTVVVSLEGQEVVSELSLENDNGIWMLHPAQADSIIYFCPWLMTIHQWSTLSKTTSIPLSPPSQENLTHSPGTLFTAPSRTGEHEHDHGIEHKHPPGNLLSCRSSQNIVIERLISTHSHRYLLVEASSVVDGQLLNMVHLLDIHHLSEPMEQRPISDNTSPTAVSVLFLELPRSLAGRMDRPLIFLGQTSGMQDTLLFLDCHHSVCTWTIPTGISQAAESSKHSTRSSNMEAIHRTDSQASTLHERSQAGKDVVDKSIVAHYSLPGDWISPDCVGLIRAFGNGSLLCPRNGEVAVVHYAGFNR